MCSLPLAAAPSAPRPQSWRRPRLLGARHAGAACCSPNTRCALLQLILAQQSEQGGPTVCHDARFTREEAAAGTGSGPQEAAGTGEPGRDAISKRALLPSPRRPWRLSSMPAPGKLDGACEWPGGGEKPQKASRCLPHPQPRGLQTALDRALLRGNRPEALVFPERCRFSGDSLALPGRQCAPARTKHSRVEMLLWLWPGLPTSSSPPPAARATFLQTAQPDRSLPT